MINFKKITLILIILSGFGYWYFSQPTEVIDVHYKIESDSYYAIVKNFPMTDMGKIQWWENNKTILSQKFSIPIDGRKYSIGFWVADYKEEPDTDQGSDLLCFYDMKSKKNCIEKNNQPLKVWYFRDKKETVYYINNWSKKYIKDYDSGTIRKG